MVLLLFVLGLLLAVLASPVVRVAGPREGVTTRRVRVAGLVVAAVALITALLIGP
jgi:hypothetical protein